MTPQWCYIHTYRYICLPGTCHHTKYFTDVYTEEGVEEESPLSKEGQATHSDLASVRCRQQVHIGLSRKVRDGSRVGPDIGCYGILSLSSGRFSFSPFSVFAVISLPLHASCYAQHCTAQLTSQGPSDGRFSAGKAEIWNFRLHLLQLSLVVCLFGHL